MDELKRFMNSSIWDQGKTKGTYRFPLPIDRDFLEAGAKLAIVNSQDEIYRLGPYYVSKSPRSHLGPFKWAVDFLVPDGTEILAADDGQIIEAVDHFNVWGETEEFKDKLNYLTILHSNGEYSQYCHLAQNSFCENGLKVGDYVRKGQIIAYVGKTGWTDRDHLHFIVLRFEQLSGNPWPYYSLEIQFEDY